MHNGALYYHSYHTMVCLFSLSIILSGRVKFLLAILLFVFFSVTPILNVDIYTECLYIKNIK